MRRALQHIPIVILVSMCFGWTGMRFFPLRCWLLGFNFDLRGLALSLPLIVFAIVVLTFRYGRVFCSWFCPTHLYLEGTRWIAHRLKRWGVAAEWLFALLSAVFVTHALVTCFVPLSEQFSRFRAEGVTSRLFIIEAGLFLWFVLHFGVLRWRFCVYACPYGILMRLFKTDETPVMMFDEAAGRCVSCLACDRVCPYELNVREQCDGDICTNCGFCAKACRGVLGKDREVLGIGRIENSEQAQG
jgi:ferredoxin-type protein NapH